MAGIIRQTETNRAQNLLDNLKNRLGIVAESKDSVVSILAEVIGSEIETIENEIYEYFYRAALSTAESVDLDEVASSDYNITRLPATLASSNKFFFYVEDGSFGEINNGSDILIPIGTLISTTNVNENNNIVYETVEEIVLLANSTMQSFYAEAKTLGSSQNVAELSLQYHNFENYTLFEENLLKVTNTEDITNGSEEETDDFLRTRCAGQTQLQVERNKNYIYLSLLNETSLYDFEIIESHYGIGTIGVIVKGNGNGRVSQSVIDNLQRTIEDEAQHLGQEIIFSNALKVNFRIEIDCTSINKDLGDFQKTNLELNIKQRVFELLKEQETNNIISFSVLESSLKQEFAIINNASNESIFSSIFTSVEDGNYGTPEQRRLNSNSNLIIDRDQYIGTDMTITVNVGF